MKMRFWKKIPRFYKVNFDWKKVLWKTLTDYAKQTSIHGFRYLCEENMLTNLFWLISIVLSMLGCSFLVYEVFIKWEENPVIVSINEKSTPIWTIPFPAVTICPEIKFKSNLYNISVKNQDDHEQLTDEQMIFQNALYPVCLSSYPFALDKRIEFAAEMRKIAIPFNEIFSTCTWRGIETKCEELFSEVLTDDGICYTFNMLDQNDFFTRTVDKSMKYPKHNKSSAKWSLQDGYNSYDSQIFPERVLGSGLNAGIKIHLIGNTTDIEHRCRGNSEGFKLALHSPNEIPRFWKQFTRIAFHKEVLINVEPQVVLTSDVLKSYKSEVRKCYFDGEKTLKYFKSYTKSNCDIECLTNFTQSTCGCVQFGMPFDYNTEICNYRKQSCAQTSESSWLEHKLNHDLEIEIIKEQSFNNTKYLFSDCNCLPSCISIQYKSEISQGTYQHNEYLREMKMNYYDDQYSSVVTIYLKDDDFIALKRSQFYGWTDFLSNCGGLFGLFMGFSILSLVEILYYFTLRWIVAKPEKVPTQVVKPAIIIRESESVDSLLVEDVSTNNDVQLEHNVNQ